MEKSKLNMLINLFGKGREIVWITDENWEIQWGRYDYSQIRSLPEILKIPEDCWDTVEKQVYWNGYFCRCTVYGSKANKCRIVMLKPMEQIPEEIAIDSAVYSLRQVRCELEKYLDEHQLYDRSELLESIERNCYLLYHKSFIRRMLRSVQEGRIIRELFPIQETMRKMQMKIQKELGIYAEVELKTDGEELFLKENKEFFHAVILAGMIFSHHHAGYFHQILFSAGRKGEEAEISIWMKPDNQQRIDITNQVDSFNFGSLSEEKQLLEAFCSIHDGEWEILKQGEDTCCRIVFRTDAERHEIELHQPSGVISEDTNEIYRIMLSRIYLSYF